MPELFQIHRHGDRSPAGTYTNDPYKYCKWRSGLAGLTPKGAVRLYTLGTNLRGRYIRLLPSDGFYAPDKLRVDSSPLERCVMSAQCVLAALLPPPATGTVLPIPWQPVGINVFPEENIVRVLIS